MSNTLIDEITDATSTVIEPLTIEQYHAMIREGILVEGAPIELIDGLLVRKDRRDKEGSITTVGPRHANTITRLVQVLGMLLDGSIAHVRSQQPVTLDGANEPEPDVSIALGEISEFNAHHPGPGAISLIVEVADSSLSFDRGEKLRKYAAAGVPTYWIVNLNEEAVEVYSQPVPQLKRFARTSTCGYGDLVEFEVSGTTMQVEVGDILS